MSAIARTARLVGGQVEQEAKGLDPRSQQRPDLQIAFPGRLILSDVVVTSVVKERSRVSRVGPF